MIVGMALGQRKRRRKEIVQALEEAGMTPADAAAFLPKLNQALGRRNLTIRKQPQPTERVFIPRMPHCLM